MSPKVELGHWQHPRPMCCLWLCLRHLLPASSIVAATSGVALAAWPLAPLLHCCLQPLWLLQHPTVALARARVLLLVQGKLLRCLRDLWLMRHPVVVLVGAPVLLLAQGWWGLC